MTGASLLTALRAEVDFQRTEKEHAYRQAHETDDACRVACDAKDAALVAKTEECERLKAENKGLLQTVTENAKHIAGLDRAILKWKDKAVMNG